MIEQRQCEFLLIRYVPDAVKDEFVNIGIVLLNSATGSADVRFTRDWRRVRCMDPGADIEMLLATEAELQKRLHAGGADRDRILHVLKDSFANALQVSSPKALLTDAPEQELSRLLEMYVERTRPELRAGISGRAAIVSRMRKAFSEAGVWQLMLKKIAAAPYTHEGDPLKIDCGYRPNGVLKLFHAVPLASDVDAAKALAFSYPQIREGVARVLGAKTELTAVVEDEMRTEKESPEIAFALATLKRSSILLASTGELPQLAEVARRELRV